MPSGGGLAAGGIEVQGIAAGVMMVMMVMMMTMMIGEGREISMKMRTG